MSNVHEAKMEFAKSLAAYSLICFVLKIKDRHNANILLDRQAHLIHIDFGYMISNTPGNLNIDNSPFKLTKDFIGVIGRDGVYFNIFRD